MSLEYLIKRLGFLVLTVWLISVIVFGITQILPANAVEMLLGQYATPDQVAAVTERLGLDAPAPVQYLRWFGGVIQGDLGTSLNSGLPVGPQVFDALGRSLLLAGLSLVTVIFVAIPLGIIAAMRQGSRVDVGVSLGSYVGISMPEFVTATLLLVIFARPELGWLPASGYQPLSEGIGRGLLHLVLPVMTLTVILTAHVSRLVRSEMVDVLQADYVRTATLKGLSRRSVILKHALRNALLPAITVLALDVGYLIGGIIVVEEIFAFPGLGRLLLVAIDQRDLPMIQAGALIMATTYALANLIADLLYAVLDRRIQYD